MRIVMHIDMDAFYASIEQRDKPELRGKPVAVRLGKSGALAAASYEARTYGVRSAMRIADAARLCPVLEIVEADFERYWQAAKTIRDTCKSRTEKFEFYRVSGVPDECWLEYELGTWEEAQEEAKALKNDIRTNTALTASVGVAYAKIPAKMASDYKKPDGLTVVRSTDEFASLFWSRGARDLFGVGAATEKKLKALGMHTIGDIAQQSLEYLTQQFKPKRGAYLYNISRGIDDSEVMPDYLPCPQPKSIGRGRTVRVKGTRNIDLLTDVLMQLSQEVGNRLNADGYYFRTTRVEIDGLTPSGNPTKTFKSTTLDYHTNSWRELYDAAVRELNSQLNQSNTSVRKISVRASSLTQEPQLTLFQLENYRV